MTREICKICYNVNRVGFSVPDSVWKEVVPSDFRDRVVCLECFTRLADEKMVEWDREIEFWPVSLATHLGPMIPPAAQPEPSPAEEGE